MTKPPDWYCLLNRAHFLKVHLKSFVWSHPFSCDLLVAPLTGFQNSELVQPQIQKTCFSSRLLFSEPSLSHRAFFFKQSFLRVCTITPQGFKFYLPFFFFPFQHQLVGEANWEKINLRFWTRNIIQRWHWLTTRYPFPFNIWW